MAHSTEADTARTSYRTRISGGSPEDIERQLALAWASLAAAREAFPRMRRVTVLRPVIL